MAYENGHKPPNGRHLVAWEWIARAVTLAALGVSYQQVQKYEHGEGLSAVQLVRIAGVLGVPPATLLQSDDQSEWGRETVEVAAAYMRLPTRAQVTVRELLRYLADTVATGASEDA